jgi:diguanylate cyclase (GGDEF)-like protein
MNIQSLLPLIAALAYALLLVFLIGNRPWTKQHQIFAVYIVSASLWSLSTFFLRSDYFLDQKLFLFRLVICFFILVVVQFYYFIRTYLYQSGGLVTKLGFTYLMLVIAAAALGYLPQSVIFHDGTVIPDSGIWVTLIGIPLITMIVILAYYLISRIITSTDPSERNRCIYFIGGISIVALFTVFSATPLGNVFPFSQIGHLFNAIILLYASLRYRILDMRFIARRSMIYAVMLLCVLMVYMFWLYIGSEILGIELNFSTSVTIFLLTGFTAALYWTRIRDFLYVKVDELFYGDSYDYRQQLNDFIRHGISGVFSLRELSAGLLPPLVKAIDCSQAFMLLPETGGSGFLAAFSEPHKPTDSPLRIRQDSPITEWLKREKRYLSRENMDILPEFRSLWDQEKEIIKSLNIELLFSLLSRGNLIGILAISRKTSGKYSLDEVNLVENAANQVAMSMEKEYLQDELKKREQELSLINRLAGVMTSSLNIQEVYNTFITGLREVIDIDFATIAMIEGKDIYFSALSTEVGTSWQVGEVIRYGGTASEWVIKHNKSLLEPDLYKDSIFPSGKEYRKRGIRSIVYLPLFTKGEGIGTLIIASRRPNAYSQPQVLLLERLAAQISTSVANAQLYARAEQRARVDELTGLFNRRHFDESLRLEIERHSRIGSTLSMVFIDLDSFKGYNDTNGHIAGDKLLTEIGQLMKNTVRNIDQNFRYGGDEFAIIMPHTSPENALAVAERVRSKIALEMSRLHPPVTASVGLASWPNDGLTTDDIVTAADRALYHTKQTGGNRTVIVSKMMPALDTPIESASSSDKETLNIIYALAATIEARDPYTYGHSRKVRGFSVALAESLGLPPEKVAAISHAALLHDIGKIGILDEILNKPGILDSSERELIKTHPQLSRTIVGHVSSLTPCLQAILHHHERWDGTGYPSGLKGESIPIEARILAIADSFDAMTSKRPYRNPLSCKEAVEELGRCSGSQFDARLIEKFLPLAVTINPEDLGITEKSAVPHID